MAVKIMSLKGVVLTLKKKEKSNSAEDIRQAILKRRELFRKEMQRLGNTNNNH